MSGVATMLVFVTTLLATQHFLVFSGYCMSMRKSGQGGLLRGDPAPGRSPGPPAGTYANREEKGDEKNCDPLGNSTGADVGNFLNLTVTHLLFNTDSLVFGALYQVVISRTERRPRQELKFSILSSIGDTLMGNFEAMGRQSGHVCAPHVHNGRLLFDDATVVLNWTAEENLRFNRSNVTFTLLYKSESEPVIYEKTTNLPITQDCQVWLKNESSSIHSHHFPARECTCWFPWPSSEHGLVVDIVRLNVPCFRGELHFSGLNISEHQYAVRSHRQARVCGKLEELSEGDRHIYFPPSHTPPFLHVRGNPVFSLNYHLVDFCYNVTFTTRNGSFELKPTGELQCTFKIYLPYGNRIALTLNIGDSATTGVPNAPSELDNTVVTKCEGLYTELLDGGNVWSHCTRSGDAERNIEAVSTENRVVLKIVLRSGVKGDAFGLKMKYRAEPVEEIVRTCEFGWVAFRQFCISAGEDMRLPWIQAEMECDRRGGHLASIRSADTQELIDNLLLNSPGYRDYNAYWIGASDKTHEGDFHWSDGLPFSYTNWFPGWPQHGNYNRQPNDDGLSEQDCVEVRRVYSLPSATSKVANGFMWNDRDCSTPNYFLCEKLQNDESPEESWPPDCNKCVILSRQQQRAVVSSPGFPRQYPDNADCNTDITAPTGYRIVLDFEELVLENEPTCSYDFLEIAETSSANGTDLQTTSSAVTAVPATSSSSAPVFNNSQTTGRRLCGDWSSKLKLLRYVSRGSRLKLRFNSDYSHHFGGFKVRLSMENVMQCADDRFQIFNNTCYLFVSYPAVTWSTARQICHGIKARLTSVLTPEEEDFITTNIRKTSEYRTTASYWLGAEMDDAGKFSWIDGFELQFTKWSSAEENDIPFNAEEPLCLATQWTPSVEPTFPSGFYWKSLKCSSIGGYVCKRPKQSLDPKLNYNRTVNGTEGELTTPNYPNNYYDSLDFSVRIRAPERTRIVLHFERIDLEPQLECLYDFVQVRSPPEVDGSDSTKFCGRYDTDMNRYDFVSRGNEAELVFHSDYSINGGGFYLRWYSVDTTGCPEQTLTAKEGVIQSPNYPHFLLANLDCTFIVLAPPGRRVWLEFLDFEVDDSLSLNLDENAPIIKPFSNPHILTDGTFLSTSEKMLIKLKSRGTPKGRGFKATYKSLLNVNEERVVEIRNVTTGALLHLNYPDRPPLNATVTHHFVAPIGHVISIELYNVRVNSEDGCARNSSIEIFDSYADTNGTKWSLCHRNGRDDFGVSEPPLVINSFLNTLYVKQSNDLTGVSINATLRVKLDDGYFKKLLKYKNDVVESCNPNPCQHRGKCIAINGKRTCRCQKHFTGLFCALTQCDLEPCVFGTCELTETSFRCHCKNGYLGATCEQKRKPCQDNPCESRGICSERGDTFHCQCHAWWEGSRCERRMMHIPYKPLSERMLHEPFWLGLMTVTVVMGVIGLVWCAKRHFPEKIEKLLAEEDDRARSTVSSLRSSSVREQLAAASAAASAGVSATGSSNPGPGVPRSLFGRLGIRKPSILSLTSPHAGGYSPATARTFSLDDLLKPVPRRSPSPKKKRNNSTPTKKNAAEKKQILQQLISPAASSQNSRKVSLGELIQMSERKMKEPRGEEREGAIKETKLSGGNNNSNSGEMSAGQLSLVDPKLEKKVTFARLLSKVSQEMSSGSDIEMGIMQSSRLSCAFARPASTPPSPGTNVRSPNSTSSNQGSDSLTSSDLAIPTALSSSVSDLMCARKGSIRLPAKQKPASADSILAMFRNFSSSSAGVNLSPSLRVSPSTTPTASSPQDDVAGDDDSSTSSIHTPVSFSSGGPPESPVMHRAQQYQQQYGTIEVPVLDALSAHKSTAGGGNFLHPPTILLEIPSAINKCLSPIREMPTPLPSPMPSQATTPVPQRRRSGSFADNATDSDDRISVEIPNISISDGDEDDMPGVQDIAIDPQAEDGLIQEEVAVMQQASPSVVVKTKSRPPPVGQASNILQLPIPLLTVSEEPPTPPPPLVIPTLIVQIPSPTHKRAPHHFGLLGSPPPRIQEDEFGFPGSCPPVKAPRRMLKEFDKPTSLDLPCAPPQITITCNLSEAESDTDSISPAIKPGSNAPSGMTYLSPFSMVTRGDHMASESNLSSSGYSSMASPGPSRCGSSNPLCPSEMEDPGGSGSNLHPPLRRHSPLIRTSTSPPDCGSSQSNQEHTRGRSDSETLSDDPLIESNDEGIGTDHIDEKIEEGAVKSAKELEVFINDKKLKLDLEDVSVPATTSMKTLQLPSIVVQCDTLTLEKISSPVSSRSESPLSDRTSGVGRFSPQFYGGHKDLLPFTDSDGLYDFPSSDKVNISGGAIHQQHRKSTGRKREKKSARSSKTPSPTKGPLGCGYHLELPKKEPVVKLHSLPRKASPKRRVRTQKMVSSSSSSESITSTKELRLSSSSPSPETIRWVSSVDCFTEKRVKSPEASGEETGDDAHSAMLPKSDQDLYRHKKISRLRTISHQIRFLRRIEQSLRRKERVRSSSDSLNSGEESPRATSPLLQPKEPKIEIRKSNSSGRLQSNVSYVPSSRHRHGKFKRGELLIPETDRAWKKVVVTGNGHSD